MEPSKVWIGEEIGLNDTILWLDCDPRSIYWQSHNLSKVYLGENSFKTNSSTIIFDTGTSLSQIPVEDFNKIKAFIIQDKFYLDYENFVIIACDSVIDPTFPDITIELAG